MMRTVLFLINGFGVEAKDSYSVYDANLMPNFDKLTKKYMFSTIQSNVRNIYDGYRNMSLEINELYNYYIYNRDAANGKINTNSTTALITKEIEERKSKLHIFCFVDTSLMIVENLKHYLTLINKNHDKKIFLHIILTSTNYEDFPKILDVLSKINIELNELATIGMVMGLSNILNSNPLTEMNFLLRNMISELGEKWASFKQKLDVSYGMKSAPSSVKPFVVNTGFSIGNTDTFLIWNYDNVDLTNFITGIKSINYGDKPNNIIFFSLFPIVYKEKINNILNFEIAKNSLATNMKGLGFKTMIVCDKDDLNGINYYLNGLTMVNNPDISFVCLDDRKYDPATVLSVINSYQQELVIFNYNITNASNVEELKDVLQKIDNVIGAIYDNTEKNSYTIVISSLYGMRKVLENDKGEICNIIYSKIPIIYADNFITKKNYLISEGTISDLLKVCYKSINKKYPGTSIIEKKNFLYRLIFK